MESIVEVGCAVDQVGEAVLEYVLSLWADKTIVLGQGNGNLIIAIICWFLWRERRKLLHGERTQQPAQIVLSVHALAENFLAATAKSTRRRGIHGRDHLRGTIN